MFLSNRWYTHLHSDWNRIIPDYSVWIMQEQVCLQTRPGPPQGGRPWQMCIEIELKKTEVQTTRSLNWSLLCFQYCALLIGSPTGLPKFRETSCCALLDPYPSVPLNEQDALMIVNLFRQVQSIVHTFMWKKFLGFTSQTTIKKSFGPHKVIKFG